MGNVFDEADRGARPESWAAPFRKALSLQGRPESRLKWYLIWARRFAAYLSGSPLHLATHNDAAGFLTALASSPGIPAPLPASRKCHGLHGKADERTGLRRAGGILITPEPQGVDRKGDGVRSLTPREVAPAGRLLSTTRARGRGRGEGR